MFAIGDRISVQEVLNDEELALVTQETESAIVRDYTLEELINARTFQPEVLGAFANYTIDELRDELLKYDSFLVEVNDGDYRLVIGFSEKETSKRKNPTILYAIPQEYRTAQQNYNLWAI